MRHLAKTLIALLALQEVSIGFELSEFEKLKELGQQRADRAAASAAILNPAKQAFETGKSLLVTAQYEKAADSFFQAMSLHYNPLQDAYMGYLESYKLRNKLPSGFLRVGQAFIQQGDPENAKNVLFRAVDPSIYTEESRSDIAEAHFLISSLLSSEDMKSAMMHAAKAVALNNTVAKFHYNLGTILFSIKEWYLSLESFRRCYELDPELAAVLPNIVYLETRVCDWSNYHSNMEKLEKEAKSTLDDMDKALEAAGNDTHAISIVYALFRQKVFVEPHMTLAFPLDMSLKLRIAKRQANLEQNDAFSMLQMDKPFNHTPALFAGTNRIKVGYVSADFKLKATAYLLRHFFQYHDRTKFEIFVLATTPDSNDSEKLRIKSDWRKDIAATVEHFIDISGMSPVERIHLIKNQLQIHLLVNMDGYSNNGIRDVSIFQVQTAPIQLNMLVYVGTLGASYIQYVITDEIASPIDFQDYYSEKFLYLPQSFFANVHAVSNELSPPSKNYKSKETFTFCNFNKHLKISPDIFELWLGTFKEIIEAGRMVSLLMLEFPKDSIPNLRKYVEENHPSLLNSGFKLDFLTFIHDPYEHQRRIGRYCDVVLDNPIYNAHTMAVDTLWAGVPILTFGNGIDMGGRVGKSILTELDIKELIAPNMSIYADIARRLALNEGFYLEIRQKLVNSCYDPISPFWKPMLYVRHLEEGYRLVWSRFLAGNMPDHVYVPKIKEAEQNLSKNKDEL